MQEVFCSSCPPTFRMTWRRTPRSTSWRWRRSCSTPSSTSQSTLLRRPRSSWNCTTLSLLRERWVGCLTLTLKEKIDLLFRRSQDLHFQKYQPCAQGSEAATSAMAALLQSVSNSGYQLVVTAPTPQPVKDQVVVNNSLFSMYSKCSGSGEYGWFTLWSGWRGLSSLHPYCGSLRLCWRCSKVTDDNHSCRTSV